MEEKEQNPIVSYDTEVTEKKYLDGCNVLLRKRKRISIMWVIFGALILCSVSFWVSMDSFEAGRLYLSPVSLIFLFFGLYFLVVGILRIALKNKTGKKLYESYLSINGDRHTHIEFYDDCYVISNALQTATRFYNTVVSWEETNSAFLLYYGNRYSRVAFFIFKDGFATSEDLHKFIKLTEKVLADKPYKRLKED